MTDDEIRAFVALCEAATAGPWTVHDDPGCYAQCECGEECWRTEYAILRGHGAGVATVLVGVRDAANAAFIAASHTAAPALAEEVLRLREVVRAVSERTTRCLLCGEMVGHATGCAIGAALGVGR